MLAKNLKIFASSEQTCAQTNAVALGLKELS